MSGNVTHFAFCDAKLFEHFGRVPAAFYLHDYLQHLKAASVVLEHHYVDRHFLDDFSEYYARSFTPPSPSCKRLHFFADLSVDDLDRLLDDAYSGPEGLGRSERALQEKYLGFVVQRPLPHAHVGRTVLKTYEVDNRRHYTVVRPYKINLAGLRLTIDGLAFQMQDGGAAVCASISLWSALQRVAYVAGHRTPTPSAITRAAQSPFPASTGLPTMQMAAALSALGYVADAFSPSTNRAAFRAKLVSCLDSHLPVVLLVTRALETGAGPAAGTVTLGHAVTVTGYSEPQRIVEVPPARAEMPSVRMKSASVEVIYVHDDNIGSHAHFELIDVDTKNAQGQREVVLRRGRTGQGPLSWWSVEDWIVDVALVPKPSKLRMSVEDVFSQVWLIRRIADPIFSALAPHYSARCASGVEYKRRLLDGDEMRSLDRSFMRAVQGLTSFPRFVGVVAVSDADGLLCEFVLDVSSIHRRPEPPLLAIVAPGVALHSAAWVQLRQVAQLYKLPLITAGPTTT